jgi:hypothetical protein
MEKKFKKWIVTTLLAAMAIPALVMIFNYVMDPLWCYSISHGWNQKQFEFNGRIQKTNYITYHDASYQGIVLGNSIVTILAPDMFQNLKVYNYSVNGMALPEYYTYLEYAKKRKGSHIDYIILGLSFRDSDASNFDLPDAKQIIKNSTSIFYRLKMLMSLDTLLFSWDNFMNRHHDRLAYYDRRLVKYMKRIDRETLKMHMTQHLGIHYTRYQYNLHFRRILRKLREANPVSKFIVFTNPLSGPLLEDIVRKDLLDEYGRWITDIVDIFGECYHFAYPNKISDDYHKYYFDSIHFYPEVGTMIVDDIFNKRDEGPPKTAIHVTRANAKQTLERLKKILAGYRSPEL